MLPLENHVQMRLKTSSGWPKKNLARVGSSNQNGGIRPGSVIAYQKRKTPPSSSAW